MNSRIQVLYLVPLVFGVVLSRSLDVRDVYDVAHGNSQNLEEENNNVQYDIFLSHDGVFRKSAADQEQAEMVEPPVKKKLRNTEKTLCVGSVTLMALCY